MNQKRYYRYYKKIDQRQSFVKKAKGFVGKLSLLTSILGVIFFVLFQFEFTKDLMSPVAKLLSPVGSVEGESGKEVFGFAPYWTIDELDNIDFSVLTTLAYFGVDVNVDGSLDREGYGFRTFESEKAQKLFEEARYHNTKVVLTLTQMDADSILAYLNDEDAQGRTIQEVKTVVDQYNLDGVNIDFEYFGEEHGEYRSKFTKFVSDMNKELDSGDNDRYVTVSLYASAVRNPRIYDVKSISEASDGIFMMAYDFATASSDQVMPTAPLYGHESGKYWYDISTAVSDFLTQMPKEKLILGLPWYGYNYPVSEPGEDVRHPGYYSYYWRWGYQYSYYVYPDASAQTYGDAMNRLDTSESGWDEEGQVGWIAYQDTSGVWRKVYQEDARSLSIKYDFVIDQDLGGVGMWALGFDQGRTEFWSLLVDRFGNTLARAQI